MGSSKGCAGPGPTVERVESEETRADVGVRQDRRTLSAS